MKSLVFIFLIVTITVSPQTPVKLMTYNLLNYPGNDTTTRNPHYRTIIESAKPDILTVQEITSQAGVTGFLNNVMNVASQNFVSGIFLDGPDSDNAVFYDSTKFNFISNTSIQTELRNIASFKLLYKATGDTLIIFSAHLKASSGSSNEILRAAEVDSLRKYTSSLSENSYFVVVGDFNIYKSSESAYQKLIDTVDSGYFVDPLTLTGTWNNSAYSLYHTQSPRVRSFGGGATGGLDDRFDMILLSRAIMDSGGIDYVEGSCVVYGNDGNHYNDSINSIPNTAVNQEVADALHYASDHLPVIVTLTFDDFIPVELTSFTAETIKNNVILKWATATELNNHGFEVQRKSNNDWEVITFIKGSGNSTQPHTYSYTDKLLYPGKYFYRLKQIDFDGTFSYSSIITSDIKTINSFELHQNYPNPFNPGTTINYSIPTDGTVVIRIFDVLGKEVSTLVNEKMDAGNYQTEFNAKDLASNIYLLQLTFDSNSITKKMILLK